MGHDLFMISLPAYSPDRSSGTSYHDGLACPSCGGKYLHHSTVRVWHRKEDAETGTFVISKRKKTEVFCDHPMNTCPSTRRDAVGIEFWCELCSAISQLNISQHKGQTFTQWEIMGRLDPEDKNTPGS